MNRRVVPFFCDECGRKLSTGNACPECKRILCHIHYFGAARGMFRRKDGLCVKCAAKAESANEEIKQT